MTKAFWFVTFSLAALLVSACTSGTETEPSASPEESSSPEPTLRVIQGTRDWPTDWTKSSIDLGELTVGLPGLSDMRDGIRPIDEPVFETVESASEWITEREPVVMLELGGVARAYPLGLLISREIVNDEVAGTPIAITYCPLCNSAVGFDRRVDGQTLRFGVSGLLRNSDLVMWDDATTSLWQQITGEAIVGEYTGEQLDLIPTPMVSFGTFAAEFSEGEVLSRDVGSGAYGGNPYVGYDRSLPFLFKGEIDDRYPAMERVVGVTLGGENKAFPFSVLEDMKVVNDEIAGEPIVAWWGAADTASALDAPTIKESMAIGTGIAFERAVNGQVLTFEPAGDSVFRDQETGSTWDLLGNATEGPLAGERLEPVVQTNHLWFAWAAFNPDGKVCTG